MHFSWLDMWSNLHLSSVTFPIKMHTIVSEVRILFCNKVLQYYQRKIQALHNTDQRVMPILLLLQWLVCSLSGNIIIFYNPSFLPCYSSTCCSCQLPCRLKSLCMVRIIQPQRMFNKLFYVCIILNQWWLMQNQMSFVGQKRDCIAALFLYCNHLCIKVGGKVTLRKTEFSHYYIFRLSFMCFLSVPGFYNHSYSFTSNVDIFITWHCQK